MQFRVFQDRAAARLTVTVGTVLALLSLGLLSPTSTNDSALVRRSYNATLSLGLPFRSPPPASPVVLVYLDVASYRELNLNLSTLWPRSLHARLLQRLRTAGARLVVFDMLFSDPDPDPAVDQLLADAIHTQGRVVLASELNQSGRNTETSEGIRAQRLVPPVALLETAAATTGVAVVQSDDDFVVRRYFAGFPASGISSLTWAAAQLLDLPSVRETNFTPRVHWLNYRSLPLELPHVNYVAALDPKSVDDAFFRDRIVLVGARPMALGIQERRDEFRSPFFSWNNRELFHPAVEVHAIQMLNLLRDDWLRRGNGYTEALALAFSALVLGWALIRIRPASAVLLALALELVLLTVTILGFIHFNFWFPWLIPALIQIPGALTASFAHHSLDWYRERRRLEANRREAQERIAEQAALLDKAGDAILVADLHLRLLYANPAATRLYGGSLERLNDHRWLPESIAEATGTLPKIQSEVLQRGEWSGELRHRTITGDLRILANRWTLIRNEHGSPRSFLLIQTDVTERKQLEAQLLRAQRLDTIGNLASGMAHDLNNALAPVLMGVQLLQRRNLDPDAQRMLEVMESNTHRGADLVRQVLLFSRGRTADFEPLDPGQVLRDLERLLRETFPRSIHLQALVPPDLWPVHGNVTQLHQVLLNLCVNARDAMPRGGTLTLAADNVTLQPPESSLIPGTSPGPYVMFVVSDTGIGMTDSVRQRIFEPFFTTKPEGQGTGLGLSTSANIIRNHGGGLRVQSTVNEGTHFEIFLPRAPLVPSSPLTESPLSPARGNQELILVIDDEESVRSLMATALVDQGYRVLVADSGVRALSLLRQHLDEIRLAIVDHMMPFMDGPTTLAEIHQLNPHLPVIIASAETAPNVAASPSDPLVTTLTKPFPLDTLFYRLHEQLRTANREKTPDGSA